jgi:hypothetical protein
MLDKKMTVSCNDGCKMIKFEYSKEDNWLAIEAYISYFYAKQDGIWSTIKNRLKMIYYILTGKEFLLYDIILLGNEIEDFKNNIREFFNDAEK